MKREVAISENGKEVIIDFNNKKMQKILDEAEKHSWYRTNTNLICAIFKDCMSLFYLAGMNDGADQFAEKYGQDLDQPWKNTEGEKGEILGFLPVEKFLESSFIFLEEKLVDPTYRKYRVNSFLDNHKLNSDDYLIGGNKPKKLSGEDIQKLVTLPRLRDRNEITACEDIIDRRLTEEELKNILKKEAIYCEELYKQNGVCSFECSYRFVGLDAKRCFFDRTDAQDEKKALSEAVQKHKVALADLVFLNSGQELPESVLLGWIETQKKELGSK